jgi:hypothetical protein
LVQLVQVIGINIGILVYHNGNLGSLPIGSIGSIGSSYWYQYWYTRLSQWEPWVASNWFTWFKCRISLLEEPSLEEGSSLAFKLRTTPGTINSRRRQILYVWLSYTASRVVEEEEDDPRVGGLWRKTPR